MDRKQRILFPLLALLFTSIVFAFVWFSGFLNSPVLVRLLQGPSASFASLPVWLRYCLLHPPLMKTLARIGFGCSVLGSTTTLYLLLKTEMPPAVAYQYLAGIGRAVLLMTGVLFWMALGDVLFAMIPALVNGRPIGQLLKILSSVLPSVPILAAFCFVLVTAPFSFVKIVRRLRTPAPAWESDSVLQ